MRDLTITHTQPSTALQPAPDGSYVLSNAKKDSSTQNTNFVISLSDPAAYPMLATLADPFNTTLHTNITTRRRIWQQIATLSLIAYTKSIIGRAYWQLLTDPDII